MFGVMMVAMGDAAGMVSGSIHTTAATIRPAMQVSVLKPLWHLLLCAVLCQIHLLVCVTPVMSLFCTCSVITVTSFPHAAGQVWTLTQVTVCEPPGPRGLLP
jgi:hypothetical protein